VPLLIAALPLAVGGILRPRFVRVALRLPFVLSGSVPVSLLFHRLPIRILAAA
jgi:hypothetical protein